MSTTSDRSWPLGLGAVAGIVAFVAGYLVTYLWQGPRVREALRGLNAVLEFFGGEQIPAWKAVGWLYFNEHFVRTLLPGLGGQQTRNFIATEEFGPVLYAIPVVVLLLAGFAVAWRRGAADLREGALDGVTVTIGYFPVAAVAVFVVGATRGDASISPDPITGVLLAGVVYPVVLGSLGGAVAGAALDS